MQELDKALEAVRVRRETRVVTVIGAAGVGKSRLVHDFLSKLRAQKEQWLRIYRGSARDLNASYGIFARVLRARFGLVEGMDEEAAKAQVRNQVAAVLDDRKVGDVVFFLGQLLELDFEQSPLTRAVVEDPLEARLLRRSVFKSFLEADAQKAPLCLVFEDLDAAHDDSLDLLRFLLENLVGPILLICVARNELTTRNEDWALKGGTRHKLVELGPLTDIDAASMMEELLSPCGEPPAQLVDAACQLAGGNPLLLEQMVRIFHDTGVLEDEDALAETPVWHVHLDKLETVRLPLTVDDAVQARISALTPSERTLLERAACMGSVFWLGALVVLERLDSSPPDLWSAADDTDERQIRDVLNELVERDYVLKLPDSTFPGDEEYVFKHNLERERIARLTPASAARRYHEAIADWLEHQWDVRTHEEYLAMLANHRERAGAQRLAALAYIDAGDVARNRYATAKAYDYYRKGLDLLTDSYPQRRMDAYHHMGDVLQQLGRPDDTFMAFREMLRIAYQLNLKAKGGAAHNRIGRLYRELGSLEEASRHLGTGLALFEAVHDERGIASSLDDIGKLYWLRGDYAKALEPLRTGLMMRRRLGDRRSIALSLNNVGLALQDSGEFKQALEAFEQALLIRREIGDLVGVIITLNNLGTVAQDQGSNDLALKMFTEALSVAREIGDRNRIALLLANIGEVHYAMNNAAEAIKVLKESEELAEELGDRIGVGDALRRLGMAYVLQQDIARARDCISRAVDIFAAVRTKVHLGLALRTLGEVTAAGGWGADHTMKARDYLIRSIAIFEEIGNEAELARSLKSYADFLLRAQDLGDPAKLAEEARLMHERAEQIVAKMAQPKN
jgi:tetratricopeptide (TPR) repeat protein